MLDRHPRSESEIIGYADGEPIFAPPYPPWKDESKVYFIQSVRGGPIKIGMALDPEERLKELQVAYPYRLRLTHTIEGGRARELALHKRFAEHRLAGEWFEPTPELAKLAYARRP